MASRWQQENRIYRGYIRNLYLLYQNRQDVRIFTELLLSLSVISIFGLFAIRPTLVTIASLSTEIESKQELVNTLDTKIDNLIVAEELYSNYRSNIDLLDTAIPKNASPIEYLRQIEGIARKNNVDVIGMSVEGVTLLGANIEPAITQNPQQNTKVDNFPAQAKAIDFSFNANGKYENISGFLSDLEALRRPIFIDDIGVSVPSVDGAGDVLLLTIAGRVPYSPDLFSEEVPEIPDGGLFNLP
ncbi:hypothetical protein C4564_03400 [Candidatus Microgenomates bacterium]|nr:MAG: hypothetical protein C4564_03400 [Candidatus Microgenomates bacterium]